MSVEEEKQPASPEPEVRTPPRTRWKRVRTPTRLQMESVECGAASLAMVLEYYGKYVALEELRVASGVSRDGGKASNVRRAAEKYGLVAKAYKRELDELWEMNWPIIVFWEFNHFLVVEGVRDDRVYLNDPATGRRTVTLREFDRSFTGIALSFEPGPDFVADGKKPNIASGLVQRLSGSRDALLFTALASLGMVVPSIVVASFARIWIDNVLLRNMVYWTPTLLLAMGIALAFQFALAWLQNYCLLRMETRLALTGASAFFRHVLRLPLVFYQQRSPGEIGNRVVLADDIATLLSGDLARAVLGLGMMVFYLVVMLYYNVILTLVSLFFAILSLVALSVFGRRRVECGKSVQQNLGKWEGSTTVGLQMIETLKADGGEGDFFRQWSGYQARVANGMQKVMLYVQSLMIAPPFFRLLNSAAVMGFGGYLIMRGDMTIGMLVAFQVLAAGLAQPVNDLVNLGDRMQAIEAGMIRVDDVFNSPADPELTLRESLKEEEDLLSVKLSGKIEFRDLTFGYSPLDPPLFDRFNLVIQPGERVALVGPTGCGKSTLARLLTGLFQPWSGDILLDDRPRHTIPRDVYINSLTMVDQNIFLFEDTVRNNITLWDRTVPESQVVAAAKDACIHNEIAARQGGYNSMVQERGRNFSGGQCQRLEIARALVNRPTAMILDEATSALDAQTEKDIDDNLRRRGCSCLIIAHRLSTIRDCDQIIVLKAGKPVQRGTHSELIKDADGLYATLVEN